MQEKPVQEGEVREGVGERASERERERGRMRGRENKASVP